MKTDHDEVQLRQDTIGKFLKRRRMLSKLTQQDVASKLKYSSPQFVSNWERGISQPPLDVFPKLAELYKIPPKELIQVVQLYQERLLERQRQQLVELFKKDAKHA